MARVLGRPDEEAIELATPVPACEEDEENALTSIPEASKPQEADCSQGLQRIWFIALLAGLFHVFMSLEAHLFLPYLYSRVHCCQGVGESLDPQYDTTDPNDIARILDHASTLGLPHGLQAGKPIPACSLPAFPPNSPLWSLSRHCVSRAYVHDTAQGIMARVKPLQKAVALLLLPVGGNLADSLGRRPVLAGYACLLLLASVLAAADCSVESGWGIAPVLVAGMMLSASFQPKDTIISSSVADVIGNGEAGKGRAFSGLMAMNTTVNLACLLAIYQSMRMRLTNYATPWLSFAGLAAGMLVIICIVKETLPKELRREWSPEMLDPIRGQVKGLRMLAKDPLLIQLSLIIMIYWAFFAGFMTTRLSYLIMLGFALEEAIFPEILGNVVGILFSALLTSLMPRIGTLRAMSLSFFLLVVAFSLWGFGAFYVGKEVAYPAAVFQQAGVITLMSSVPTAVSQRAGQSHQAICQATLQALGGLGAMISVPLYNKLLFSATAEGLDRARPAIVSMGLAFVCLILSLRMSLRHGSAGLPSTEGL